VISGTFWGPDFANPVNQKFVDDFEKKTGRIPSQYAAQAYDSALLLDSAIAKVKGNVADKPAFMAALKAGDSRACAASSSSTTTVSPSRTCTCSKSPRIRRSREPEDDRVAAQGPRGCLPRAVHAEVA
jgi:hypothetical protein